MPPITEAAIRSVTIQKEVMSANAAVVSYFLAINTNATVSKKKIGYNSNTYICGTIYLLCPPIFNNV